MKSIKKKSLLTICLLFCFVFSVLTATIFALKTNRNMAFADEDSNLSYTLNSDGTGYIVKAANRQITEAIIPAYYNDLPVTEVASSAFISCTQLEKVIIPETVTKVGSNAFMNCKALHSLRGMANVLEIGNNAFAICTALENLIIPSSVEKLGSSIIKSITNPVYVRASEYEIMALNASWNSSSTAQIIYGNDLTCSAIYENDEIIGYRVEEWQILDCADVDLTFVSSYYNEETDKFYPVIELAPDAFAASTFNSFTMIYDEENLGSDYSVKVCLEAFMAVTADSVDIEVDIEIDENATGIFDGSIELRSISLPDTIDVIPDNMFSYCETLEELMFNNSGFGVNELSDKIVKIGNNAFCGCKALPELYIPESVEFIGSNVFEDWGTLIEQTIYMDMYAPADDWDENWDSSLGDNVSIEYNPNIVMFEKDGGSKGTNFVQACYDKIMPAATAPKKSNYTFMGYFDEKGGKGTQYYDSEMNGAKWDKKEPAILYAYWKADEYIVQLDNQGGTGETESITAAYGEAMPDIETVPVLKGHTFKGYYTGENGTGTKYYNEDLSSARNFTSKTVTVLYAYWVANEYIVTLDANGGIGGTAFVKAIVGADMPVATAPVKNGFKFIGYFKDDKMYYDNNMTSENTWDIDEDTTLIANWTRNDYEVTLDNNGGEGENKIVMADFNEDMPDAEMPIRTGYTFTGYYTEEGIKYYNADMTSAKEWDIDHAATLYAHWNANSYEVTLDKQNGSDETDKVTAIFDSEMPRAAKPTWTGHTFTGYYTEDGDRYYDEEMFSVKNWDIADNTTLHAQWDDNIYTVTLDKQDGTDEVVTVPAVFGHDMPVASKPIRVGYTFNGYYTEKYGKGVKYYNADMSTANQWTTADKATLYAYWTANTYIVTLVTGEIEVTFGDDMPSAPVPMLTGNTFGGYHYGDTKYYYADMTSAHKWDIAGNIELEPEWTKNEYKIYFNPNGGTVDYDEKDVVYSLKIGELPTPTYGIHVFNGWFYEGDLFTSETVYNIEGSIVLTANWTYRFKVTLDHRGGTSGTEYVIATYGEDMPSAEMPEKYGYMFCGYYSENFGKEYYTPGMLSKNKWDIMSDYTIFADWWGHLHNCIIDDDWEGGAAYSTGLRFGDTMLVLEKPVRPGYEFLGYVDLYSGKQYYDSNMHCITDKYDKDDDLFLLAHWKLIYTTIEYNLNEGTNHKDNKEILNCGDTLILQNPERRGYAFDGWYLNNVKVTQLSNLTQEKITLEARWIGKIWRPGYTTDTIEATGLEYIILSLPSSINCEIIVGADVKQLYIYSPNPSQIYYMCINIEYRQDDFTLILENVSFKPKVTKFNPAPPSICFNGSKNTALNLYTYGTVNIYGGDSKDNIYTNSNTLNAMDANCAIMCSNLVIYSADNLNIYGGNGGDGGFGTTGVVGGKGGDGGVAIWADYSIYIMTNNVTIIGGNGGDGGYGNGGDASASEITQFAYAGTAGKGSTPYIGGSFLVSSGVQVNLINGTDGVRLLHK